MRDSYPQAIKAVLLHEGGYVNHPKDPGGATNKGVTQKVYDAYRVRHGEPILLSVKSISDGEVHDIYRMQYWNAIRGDELPAGIDYCVFDFAVNSGPSRAVKYLQTALGVKPDGLLGLVTLQAAIEAGASPTVIQTICNNRLAFLKGLKTWPTFGKGWGSRVEGVRKLSLQLASKPLQMTPQPVPHIPTPVVAPRPIYPPVAPQPAPVNVFPAPEPPKRPWWKFWG